MAITAGTSWMSPVDFGVSEWLSSKLGTQVGEYNPAQNIQNTGLDYSNPQVLGASNVEQPTAQVKLPGAAQNPVSNQQPAQQNTNPPMQSNPEQPSINWDEIYQPAFEALTQAEQAQQSSYNQGMRGVQGDYATNTADLQNEQKTRMSDYGEQRQTNTKSTEGAVAEARRMASQIQQGLQSQYGGSTGTGQFRGELLGAAATSNIANNRAALQTALTGIAKSESALKDKVLGLQNSLDQQLQTNKLQLKASLDQALSQIAQSRGQLAVDKGARRADALSQYKQQLAQVDAANTQFKQQLYLEAQQQAQKITSLKQSVQDKFKANNIQFDPSKQYQVGNTTYGYIPNPQTGSYETVKGTKTDELTNPFEV